MEEEKILLGMFQYRSHLTHVEVKVFGTAIYFTGHKDLLQWELTGLALPAPV